MYIKILLVYPFKSDIEFNAVFIETLSDRSPSFVVIFSPVYENLNPTELADWILERQLNVRLQLQLHKILWGDAKGK